MKKSLIAFVALGLVSGLSLAATAEEEEGASRVDAADAPASKIYRTTDEKGNVVFTDQPGENSRSEEVKLKTTNTVPIKKVEMPEAVSAPEEEAADPAVEEYTSLTITSPESGSTLRNPTDAVYVSVNLQPGLQPGDSLVLLDNGAEQPALQLDAPERGVHNLIVKVVSEEGETRITSEPVEVYIHRSTVSDFRNFPGGGSNGGAAQVGGAADRGGSANVGGSASTGGAASVGGGADRGTAAQPAKPNRSIRSN
ncbi:DUF4124 domain-containing protein [Alcanivorax sp. DG881]|jgi:hypothetical protein|uniref:DUF4124 domain-containing protein n=1 Tax=Alcanivorax sp. DG881 TaxID=236097 RepID=UPI000300CD84|nr:DUF4124 domain-containing protein [Alcanivorax sp. DG881]